jgi:hypothetical protein
MKRGARYGDIAMFRVWCGDDDYLSLGPVRGRVGSNASHADRPSSTRG